MAGLKMADCRVERLQGRPRTIPTETDPGSQRCRKSAVRPNGLARLQPNAVLSGRAIETCLWRSQCPNPKFNAVFGAAQ